MEGALNPKNFKSFNSTQVCCPGDIQVNLHNKCDLTSHYVLISEIKMLCAQFRSFRKVAANLFQATATRQQPERASTSHQKLWAFVLKAGQAVCLIKFNIIFLSEFLKLAEVSLIKKVTKGGEGVSISNPRGVFTVKDHKEFSHERNPLEDAFITLESELF